MPDAAIDAWFALHPGWSREGEALVCAYRTADFGAAVAFVVRVGFAAEKRDHHPDLEVRWGLVRVRGTTHDAGGISALDLELAQLCDGLAP